MNCRFALLTLAAILSACSDGIDVPRKPTRLVYDGSSGDIPLPNDVLFEDNDDASNLDGTLNLPEADSTSEQKLYDALNSLDGWSTVAPLSFQFSEAVDAATVVAGTTVRLFEADAEPDPITGFKHSSPITKVIAELVPGVDYRVEAALSDPSGATWWAVPLIPLKPKTIYMLVVTDGVVDEEGFTVRPGTSYQLAKATNPYPPEHPVADLQVQVRAMELVVSTDPQVVPAIPAEQVVMSLSFTTQSIFEALSAVVLVARGQEAAVLADICSGAEDTGHVACTAAPANTVPVGAPGIFKGDSSVYFEDALGYSDLYSATLTLPYYLTAAANADGGLVQDDGPLMGRWRARFSYEEGTLVDPMETDRNVTRYNPLPLETTTENIPVLIALPNDKSPSEPQPATGWPVVIFQHGVTRNREDMIAIADVFSASGFATVAIDMPLHGVVDTTSLLHEGYVEGGLRERNFGLDLVTQDSDGDEIADEPDGEVDTSGAHFINLEYLQTQRDNLRQAVVDLVALVELIKNNLNVDGEDAIVADDFDPTQIHFVGMSLGAIVGTVFTAVDEASANPVLLSSTLNVPGGGIPRMLEASPTYGSVVIDGLADEDVIQGTPEYDSFMWAGQTVIDAGDPINFCASLNGGSTPILLQEVVGGGPGGGEPDDVVVNNVPIAPLSGTDPMVAVMGLTQISVVGTTPTSAAVVRLSEGAHSSLLNPDPDDDGDIENLLAWLEMQSEVAYWLASISTTPAVTITSGSVIAR
jgi:dienelactone hydrolase